MMKIGIFGCMKFDSMYIVYLDNCRDHLYILYMLYAMRVQILFW